MTLHTDPAVTPGPSSETALSQQGTAGEGHGLRSKLEKALGHMATPLWDRAVFLD